MVGTERFENFASLNRSEVAFSKSSLPLLLGPFINSFIMICESMLSASQDGLLREMLLSKYRLQIFDYIYIRFQILLVVVSKSIGFFCGGPKLFPPVIKHWVGGPVALSGH
jgi:hypothetical protein